MGKNDGYILLFRCMMENEFLFEPDHKYTKAEMWMDMLTMARWQNEPCSFKKRGNIVTIKRGEFAKCESTLAEKWGWSKPSIIKILKEFENEGMITISRSNKINVIGIVNYDKYQNFATKGYLPQKEQRQYSETSKNSIDFLPQNLPQNLPQVLPQNLPHLKESINKEYNNNICCCYSDGFEKKLFDGLRRYDTQWKEQRCRTLHLTLEAFMDYIDKFEQICQKNQSWHNYTNNVASDVSSLVKHFNQWIERELNPKPKQQSNGTGATNGFTGRGAYEPSKNATYEGRFGD